MIVSRLHKLVEEVVLIDQGHAGSSEFDLKDRLRRIGWPSPIQFLTAETFVMGSVDGVPQEMVDFGFDLMKRGLFHLPYSQSIFEFSTDQSAMMGKRVEWITILAFESVQEIVAYPIYSLQGEGYMFARSAFGYSASDGPKYYEFTQSRSHEEEHAGARQTQRLLAGAVSALISKSVSVTTVNAPEKLNKARLKRGRIPLLEYKVVTIPGRPEATPGGAGAAERHPPRLHWRRGHYRLRRATGARDVPVAPCLVGSAANGVVRKDYFVEMVAGSRQQLGIEE